jgi:hypothetical protein
MPPSAPIAKPTFYDFAQCLVTIQGVALSHYGADGTIAFEYYTPELRTSDVSADGKVHMVKNNDPRMRVKLTFKRVCPAVYTLRNLAQTQDGLERNLGGLQTFNFGFWESVNAGPANTNGNGDSCVEPFASFETLPAPEYGKDEGELEFSIFLPNGREVFQFGTAFNV